MARSISRMRAGGREHSLSTRSLRGIVAMASKFTTQGRRRPSFSSRWTSASRPRTVVVTCATVIWSRKSNAASHDRSTTGCGRGDVVGKLAHHTSPRLPIGVHLRQRGRRILGPAVLLRRLGMAGIGSRVALQPLLLAQFLDAPPIQRGNKLATGQILPGPLLLTPCKKIGRDADRHLLGTCLWLLHTISIPKYDERERVPAQSAHRSMIQRSKAAILARALIRCIMRRAPES